jgi:tetratricopeptide (TPR) repeat protein
MGVNFRKIGDYEKSLDALNAAREIKADRSSIFNNIGLTYVELGEFGEAASQFTKAI